MASRVVLIKFVLQAIPSFIMQTFLIPKAITFKLDKLLKNFFWGFDMEKDHHLHLCSWDAIYQPKAAEGLGIRRFGDMNKAMVMKLNWQLSTGDKKPWIQLIRAKYLRGRRCLDFQQTRRSVSWVWSGITHCGQLMEKGTCYQLGKSSRVNLREDPWIPSLPSFKLPAHLPIPTNFHYVRDLMAADGLHWNEHMITAIFLAHIRTHILNTPILEREHDSLVWTASKSGSFTVKSAYGVVIQERRRHCSRSPSSIAIQIWKSPIHARHRILL